MAGTVPQRTGSEADEDSEQTLDDSGTPYGDLTVVDRDNRFDVSAEYPLSEQADLATAGVTRIPEDSVFRLRANASTESLETVDILQYSPGYIAETGMALQIPVAPTGDQEVRWGYWDGSDGAYWGYDATGVFVEAQRNGTRQDKVYSDDWNGADTPVDAAEILQNGGISRVIAALYNYGSVGFELFERGGSTKELGKQSVHNLSVDGQTTLSKQNLPLRMEVDNPAAEDFDVFLADRQATIRGNFTDRRRLKGEERTGVSLSGTDWVPVLTIRKKAGFESIDVGVFSLAVLASDPVYLQWRSDAGSTTHADYDTPTDVDASETAVEVDTTPTGAITDGFYRYQDLFPGGGQGNNATPLGNIDGVDLSLKRDRPFTLFARRVSGTGGTINAIMQNWEESW